MTTVPSPGVQILSAAIAGVASVTSLVPAAKFYGGAAPQGLVLPALVFVSLSRRKLKTLSRSGRRRMFERVKVAAIAADYETQAAIVAALEDAGDMVFGDIAGCTAVSISWESTGPDLYMTDPPMFEQAADFLVSFTEA